MRIIFVLFLAMYLFSFETKIVDIKKNIITIKDNIKRGVSGIVLCPYENKEIICASCVSVGNKKAKLEIYDNLENKAFALPIVYPKPKDKVIFKKNYDRIVIIAPNQFSYLRVKDEFKNFVVVPVDVFAAFLKDIPSKKDFINFAKQMDIGLYIFVLDELYVVDANSFYVLSKRKIDIPKKFEVPFYSSYDFGIKEKNIINYYKKMLRGLND